MRYFICITFILFCSCCVLKAQSPWRIFTLDCNLNTESERATASVVTKAFLVREPDMLRNSRKIKPYAPMDWGAFRSMIDTLHAKLPPDGEFSWEEDYGLKTEGSKQEKWKELTFYHSDFKTGAPASEIIRARRFYLLQIRISLDAGGQIESMHYVRGKQMKNRESNILHAYKILYKTSGNHKKH